MIDVSTQDVILQHTDLLPSCEALFGTSNTIVNAVNVAVANAGVFEDTDTHVVQVVVIGR